jgi:hypothetical protein
MENDDGADCIVDGDIDMRAERLTRKTHFRRNMVREDGVVTYDLVGVPCVPEQLRRLAHVEKRAHRLEGGIEALPYAFETQDNILEWCRLLMAESPTAKKLWENAEKAGWIVGLMDLHNDGFYIDVANRRLYLDHFSMNPSSLGRSAYFRNILLTTFIRALRDIWHEEKCGAFEREYSPEDTLMLERVRAADCDTVTMLCGWELRGAGYGDIWRHLIGSEEGDMAVIFTRFLERDPSALFDGSALAYAFRQWYADEARVDGCDHETLESLDDLLGGAENPFGCKTVDGTAIEAMSALPDGTYYLAGMGETVRRDPFFAGLNDPINQTHLFHLIYDTEVTMVSNVPFRDARLAKMIFPNGEVNMNDINDI